MSRTAFVLNIPDLNPRMSGHSIASAPAAWKLHVFNKLNASPELIALEAEVYEAMLDAYRQDDHDAAEMLYKVWIKLPSKRPYPLQDRLSPQ
jgi:hypothetical protein